MQYNEKMYNTSEYNFNIISQNCIEDIASSDTLTKSIGAVRTESQPSSDNLTDGHTLFAFVETVTSTATLSPVANKILAETYTLTDLMQPFSIEKVLTQLVIGVDSVSFTQNPALTDFILFSEDFRIEITNKALSDTVRLNDWLSFERTPATNEWFD